jgi:hypothetical protein
MALGGQNRGTPNDGGSSGEKIVKKKEMTKNFCTKDTQHPHEISETFFSCFLIRSQRDLMKKKNLERNQTEKCFYFAKKLCGTRTKITRNVPILFSSLKQKK